MFYIYPPIMPLDTVLPCVSCFTEVLFRWDVCYISICFVPYAIYLYALFTRKVQRTMFGCIYKSLQQNICICLLINSLPNAIGRDIPSCMQSELTRSACNLSANVVKDLWRGARHKALTLWRWCLFLAGYIKETF